MKIFKYIALFFFSTLWFLGCSRSAAIWLNENHFTQDDYRYGDLYRFSNLAQFKAPLEKCHKISFSKPLPIALTLMGDSFTEEGRIEKNDFPIETFNRFHVTEGGKISLDKNLRNVLIIETVERHFRERFEKRYENLKVENKFVSEKVSKLVSVNEKEKKVSPQSSTPNPQPSTLNPQSSYLTSLISNYSVERHKAILFSSDFFLKIKEAKAAFTEKVFGRTDPNVAISPDKKHLLYNLDVKPGINSCFDAITEEEINQEVANINATYEFYKQQGFDEVILSIIPNKTSIVAPNMGQYNHLIERIQQHPNLKMPIVDIYTPFTKNREKYYELGDSHWNCAGKQIWIEQVNKYFN